MRPIDTPHQRRLEFALETDPAAALLEYDDYYGNHVHSFSIHPQHDALTIVARALVETIPHQNLTAPSISFEEFLNDDRLRTEMEYDFLSSSPYVPFSDRMRRFFWIARPRRADDVGAYVQQLVRFVRDQFSYEPGVTKVYSTADEILTVGAGVCQDFAHLTIALLRLAGVPARYVSGYLAPPEDATIDFLPDASQASHAWIDAQIPGLGWTGFDPTHGCRSDTRHIRVAVGRDYSDVTPLRGVYRSYGNKQTMTVDLKLEPAPSQAQSQSGSAQQ